MKNPSCPGEKIKTLYFAGFLLFFLTVFTYSLIWILYRNKRIPEFILLLFRATGEIINGPATPMFILFYLLLLVFIIAFPALFYAGVFYILRDYLLKKGPFGE